MSKPELGTKRDCPSCGAKFYDLNKNPVVCPKCEHEYVPDTGTKAKRAKPAEKPKEKASKRVVAADDEGNVSLDAMRDDELAADTDDDIDLDDVGVDVDDDDDANDAFLEDDEDGDDVTDIVRGGKGGDDD
ncbi:TIGR02300 family protein [Parvibaculum sp.]|uniref:TIGR02300 family protein n=1 Tax=Parvibaculum sp. TaxID=2024848 RepID=UPI000C538C62|nr:TIGR02300 family protein [Parvibaculum sp.]MAM94432.1 TIGR02300 family protein [Parvibaculum sp.]HCX68110.1 TIGR02300 family protein [Rhodobiaceae bacterium]